MCLRYGVEGAREGGVETKVQFYFFLVIEKSLSFLALFCGFTRTDSAVSANVGTKINPAKYSTKYSYGTLHRQVLIVPRLQLGCFLSIK